MASNNPDLGRESLQTWEANAKIWDESVGDDGNKYWKRLQEPCLARLLADHVGKGRNALELACGNGLCAAWLAARGCSVVATDGSGPMVERAATRRGGAGNGIMRFQKLDVTDAAAFASFMEGDAAPEGGFDIVLMNMAIMDVSTLDPLAAALPKLLKKGGVFVATMLHPVFFTSNYTRNVQIQFNAASRRHEPVRSKTITEYLHVAPSRDIFAKDQDVAHFCFHRPLHELFATFFRAGLVMDALEEPSFTEADAVPERIEASSNFVQLPALLAFRLRRAA